MVKNRSKSKLSEPELEQVKEKYYQLRNEDPDKSVHAVKIQLESGDAKIFWTHKVSNGIVVSDYD